MLAISTSSGHHEPRYHAPLQDRFLRLEQVKQMVGLGKTMIYRLVNEGTFPRPCKPGGSATRWSETEVLDWMSGCSAARAQ
jgi:prophage regulatory protein